MKLKPPKGCAAVSIGGATYALGPDGLIEVPEADAALLLQSHGFTLPVNSTKADPTQPSPARYDPKPAPKRAPGTSGSRPRARPPASPNGKTSRGREE